VQATQGRAAAEEDRDQAHERATAAAHAAREANTLAERATPPAKSARGAAEQGREEEKKLGELARRFQKLAEAAAQRALASRKDMDSRVSKRIEAKAEAAREEDPAEQDTLPDQEPNGYVVMKDEDSGEKMWLRLPESYQVGKADDCELVLKGWRAPRKAVVIVRGFDKQERVFTYTLLNVAPKPEVVRVNNKKVSARVRLKHGDQIEVCGEALAFEVKARARTRDWSRRPPSGQWLRP